MNAASQIGLFASAMAGTISFLSPCVLPLVPGYISYIAGNGGGIAPARLATVALAAFFVLGFSTVFIVLGASATLAGQLLLSYKYELNLAGGAIVILFGIFATGLVPMPWLERELRFHGEETQGGYLGSYVLGLAFGFGWTPCIGPVLGAILTISAATATVQDGVALLAAYSVGLGIPFLAAAYSTNALLRGMGGMRRLGKVLKVSAGGTMVAVGVAMMTGYLSTLSYWLLETFPLLSTIG